MSAVSGHASFNDGTVYNSYHQAGTAQSFREILVLIILITVNHSCPYDYCSVPSTYNLLGVEAVLCLFKSRLFDNLTIEESSYLFIYY